MLPGDGNDVIFGAWDTKLRSLDRRTGTLRWQWDNGKTANLYSHYKPENIGCHIVLRIADNWILQVRR